ncbi:hypothetical protein V5799_026595 [Amblyomma americanum]|uniref:Retrotransposon gag domain-containing protein n=1 Tax=Amblyomma americanum TaxID=6943 RepID=A0AAQ4DI47_AMBAM
MTSPQSRLSIAPPVFKGTPEESVAEWLTCYEHVASLNCWDSDPKVKFLYLALDGDAKKWYTTQLLTGAPSSWSDWAAKLKACFSSRHAAEIAYLRLQNRMQLPTESPEQYFYDVMQLCARVDPKMPEEDRLRHLLRGLQPATIEKMIISNPTTCADFLQILQRLSQATLMSLASRLLPTPASTTYLPTGAWNSNIHATPNSATTGPVPAPGQPHLLPACTAASYRQQQRLEEVKPTESTAFVKGIGGDLSPAGETEVLLQFGSAKFSVKFIVLKDCPYELLGGLPFCRQANLLIDFRQKELKIGSDVYRLQLDAGVQSQTNIVTARSEDQVRIEPRTEAILRVRVPRNGIQLVEPNSTLRSGLRVARTVMNVVGGIGIVHVANPTLSPIVVHRETKIGWATSLHEAQLGLAVPHDPSTTGHFDVETGPHLTPSERGKTTKLLHRYHGPFRLLRKVSENNWEVVDRTGSKRDVVNVERLKLCHTRVSSDEDADDESANSGCGVDGVHELGGSVRVSAKPKRAVASTVTNNDHETSGESATEAYSYSESAHQNSHAGPQTETKAVRTDYDSETEIYYSADESVD